VSPPPVSMFPALATQEEIDFLCETIRALPPGSTVVEVGVWEGGTTVPAAHAAREAGMLLYWAVDHFHGSPDLPNPEGSCFRQRRFLQNVEAAGLMGFVAPMLLPSLEAAHTFEDASLGLAFIDADHSHIAVASDIAAWWPKVAPGGFLCGHDHDREHPGVMRAVHEFVGRTGFAVDLSGGRWPVWRCRKPC
jgi:hypothetical protein